MDVMLTTVDNPFDPFVEFKRWNDWDIDHGYDTCALLDRIALTSDEFGEIKQNKMIEDAMDELIELHGGKFYVKVLESDAE